MAKKYIVSVKVRIAMYKKKTNKSWWIIRSGALQCQIPVDCNCDVNDCNCGLQLTQIVSLVSVPNAPNAFIEAEGSDVCDLS